MAVFELKVSFSLVGSKGSIEPYIALKCGFFILYHIAFCDILLILLFILIQSLKKNSSWKRSKWSLSWRMRSHRGKCRHQLGA